MFTRKTLRILAWEFTQRIKSKSFLFSLFFMPVVVALFVGVPAYLNSNSPESTITIAVADQSGLVVQMIKSRLSVDPGVPLINILEIRSGGLETIESDGMNLLRSGVVHGFLVVSEDADRELQFKYYRGESGKPLAARLDGILKEVVLERRLREMGMDAPNIAKLTDGGRFVEMDYDTIGDNLVDRYLVGIVLVMMLFLAMFNSGSSFLRGLLEERSNKVIEVLVSSVSSRELMAGKMLGLGLVGMMQLVVWSSAGYFFRGTNAPSAFSTLTVILFVLYFVIGYLTLASLLSLFGSLFSNEQDVQNWQGVLSLVGLLPVGFAFMIMDEPDSVLVTVLSYVPLLTPTLMTLRLAISEPAWHHLAGTLVTSCVFLFITIRFSGRVLDTSLRMAGQRLTLRELLKSYRAPI